MDRLMKILLSCILAFSLIPLFLLVQHNLIYAGIASLLPISLLVILVALKSRSGVGKLDSKLVTAIVHMYVVSMGEVGPKEILNSVAKTREYGVYSRIFKTIRGLAIDMGHGISKALSQVAKTVKPPLKDILIRMTEAFSTTVPRDFLELEASTILEEYYGYYTRSLESLRVVGGVFSTFQSVSVFIVLTVAVMTIFMADSSIIPLAYIVAAFSMAIMLIVFRMVSPKESIVYIHRDPPEKIRIFRLSLFLIPLAGVAGCLIYILLKDFSYVFLIVGSVLLIPGLLAYMIERSVLTLDEYYPTFLKSLGEHLSSTLNMKSALEYSTHVQLGPLDRLARNTLKWILLGISYERSLLLMGIESTSNLIFTFNRILSDIFRSGSPPLKACKTLSNVVIRFLEFRKRRLSAAKGVEMTVIILQPITIFLLVTISGLMKFFTNILQPLPYFPFNTVPLNLIQLGNALLVFLISTLNSLAIVEVKGSFKWVFLFYNSILLLISGVTWIVGNLLIGNVFSMFQLEAPI